MGTGLFALDIILDQEGKLLSHGMGGSAGNVLSILAGFGWDVFPIAELGDDLAGEMISQEFTALGADLRYLNKSHSSQTPVVYQQQLGQHSPKTHKFSFACPHCGEKRPLKNPQTSLIEKTDFDYLIPDVLYLDRATELGVQLAEHYRNKNVLVVFEPSEIGRDPGLFTRALNAAHIIKYADDRLADLQSFDTNNVSVEICTMGSAGLRYRAPSIGHEWVTLDAFDAPHVVDTSGAGDWCTSGMIYHLFNEGTLNTHLIGYNQLYNALRFGQALSALNCMTLGARGLTKAFPLRKIIHLANSLKNSRPHYELKQTIDNSRSFLETWYLRFPSLRRRSHRSLDLSIKDGICCGTLN